MTATALRLEDNPSAAEVIAALEAAELRPDEALRAAVGRAGEIAPAVIEILDEAASGAELLQAQENLLFWGIHVLGAARRTELYRPLLRFCARARTTISSDCLALPRPQRCRKSSSRSSMAIPRRCSTPAPTGAWTNTPARA